jgi:hypothetical protein
MALALPLLAGLVVAPLLGGSWRRLGDVRLRWPGLFFAAIVLQVAAFPVAALRWHTPDRIAVGLWLASYALLAAAAARNRRLPGVQLLVVGMVSNLSAILANGGHMPALPSALRAAGLHFQQSRDSTASASPHLAWLVDRWAVPRWVPYGNVFSVGDILIVAGGVVFMLAATGVFARLRSAVGDRRRPAATAAELEATLPSVIGDAVQSGLREQALPLSRRVAELRGLVNQVIRRLEDVESGALAERTALSEELSQLAELVTAGQRSIEQRLEQIEEQLAVDRDAAVYRLPGRQAS